MKQQNSGSQLLESPYAAVEDGVAATCLDDAEPSQPPPTPARHRADVVLPLTGAGFWGKWAWVPIPLFAIGMFILWAADLRGTYEAPFLLSLLNLAFTTLVSLFVAFLAGRTFVANGQPGLLTLGCGMLIWGVVSVVAPAGFHHDVNASITVHNLGLWFCAFCQLLGAMLALRTVHVRSPGSWLALAYGCVLGVMGLLVFLVFEGRTPLFFIQGVGGTPLRQFVLATSVGMLVLTTLVIGAVNRTSPSPFLYWYALGLALLAAGLAGVMAEAVFSGALCWTGRAAQYLGGVYILVATIASVRETGTWGIPLAEALRQARRESAFLGDVLEHAAQPFAVGYADGRIGRVNRAFEQLTGYTVKELRAIDWSNMLTPPEWREVERQKLKELDRTGQPVRYQKEYVRKDGTRVPIELLVHLMRDAAGRPDYYYSFLTDITERKRAEGALIESQALLRAVMEGTPDPVYVKDRESRILLANPALAKVAGKPLEELVGRTDAEYYGDAATGQALREHDLGVMASGQSDIVEETVPTPQGCRTFLSSKAPFRNAAGEIIGIIGISRDITERKRAEERNRQQGAILAGINRILKSALTCDTEEELGRTCLEEAGTLTQSSFGFVGCIDPQTGLLNDVAISDPGWSACRMQKPVGHGRKQPVGFKVHGLYGRVMIDGKGFFTNNPASHPDSIGTPPGHPPIKAFLGVPLIQDGNTIGMIGLANREGGYGESELRTAETIAVAVVQALMRRQSEQTLRRTADRLELLSEVSARLLAATEPQMVVDDLCRRALAHLDCQVFFNFLVDEPAGRLRLNACAGLSEEEISKIRWLDYGTAVCGCAARDGCRIVAEHIPSTPDPRTELVKSYGIKAYACNPLLGPEGKVIGTLSFGTRTRETFSEDDLSLMKAVADQVATAMMRMEHENALQRSQADLHRAQAVARTGSWWLDTRRNQLLWSDETYRLFGIPKGAPLSYETFLNAIHPDDRDYVNNSWNAALRGEPYEIDHRILAEGKVKWVREKAELDLDRDGSLLGGFGTVQDITERKQEALNQALATEVLRILNCGAGDLHAMAHEVLRLIKESMGLDAVGLRIRQGRDCPYYEQIGFSDDFLRQENSLCAHDPDGAMSLDAAGQPVLECTCGVVLSGWVDRSMPCFTSGGSFWTNLSTELLALAPAADPRANPRNRCIHAGYLSVALIPVRSGEEIIGLLQLNGRRQDCFTLELIHFFERLGHNLGLGIRRKQTEEALAAAKAAAEEANAAKDRFLAVLSHELRTPLSPVLMTASALELDDSLSAELRDDMALIRRSVELEVRLINDLLDFNRVKWSKLHLDLVPVDAHVKLNAAVEICRPEAFEKQINLSCSLNAESSWVNADAARIQQVFWNLLKNAIKFTPQRGRIEIRSSNPTKGILRIECTDDGIGIDPEALAHVFEPFVQASGHVTRQFGGLGLGLAIGKSLVEMHGGTIRAESAGRGQGTSFMVELPLVAMPKDDPAAETLSAAEVCSLRILFVEDHETTANVVSKLLMRMGHEVCVAGSVAQALEQLTAREFDLLISDLGLPDGSGHDLMRKARESRPSLRAFAMSGYGTDADVRQSREAGFIEHLTKPVALPTLKAAIGRLIGA